MKTHERYCTRFRESTPPFEWEKWVRWTLISTKRKNAKGYLESIASFFYFMFRNFIFRPALYYPRFEKSNSTFAIRDFGFNSFEIFSTSDEFDTPCGLRHYMCDTRIDPLKTIWKPDFLGHQTIDKNGSLMFYDEPEIFRNVKKVPPIFTINSFNFTQSETDMQDCECIEGESDIRKRFRISKS